MKGKYFGYGCKFFSGQWETCDVEADTERTYHYKEFEPVLNFCNHPENKLDEEGNCHEKFCPLKLKKEAV